jgi:hypothetical protein
MTFEILQVILADATITSPRGRSRGGLNYLITNEQ